MAIVFPGGTQSLPSKVVQAVSDSSNTQQTALNGSTWYTFPDLSVSITPMSTSSKILLIAQISWWINSANEVGHRFIRNGSTAIGLGSTYGMLCTSFDYQSSGATWMVNSSPVMYIDSPSTTSQVTYTVQSQMQGPTGSNYLWFNRGYDTGGSDAASATSFLTALEVAS